MQLKILALLLASPAITLAADTNALPRLTVDLRDGSRVVGQSLKKDFKFHSELLGELKLNVQEIRVIEFVSTNSVKVKAANGDTLNLQPADASLAVKTSFGKIELPMESIRKLSVAAAGAAIPQRDGLVGFWPGDGSGADLVGGHNGVLVGGANFAPGPAGQAFNFDGLGSYVKIPKLPALDPGKQVTVEFWMKAGSENAMDSYQGLVTSDFYGVEISNGYGGQMGVNFFLSNRTSLPVRSGAWGPANFDRVTTVADFSHISDANGGGAPVSAGQWHHVAATYDGRQMRLYIDGRAWGNPVFHQGAIRSMLPESFVSIGSEDGRTTCPDCVANRYFKGAISAVAIYNRALSADEVREDFAGGDSN